MKGRTVLGLSLRQHIGGRWAISWQIYLINLPLNLLAISTSIRVNPQGAQWWQWVFVALVGALVIGFGFVLANATYLRKRRERPVPIWVVVATGLTIGVARGATVVTLAAWLGLQPFTVGDMVNRMMAGGFLGAVMLPLSALVLSVVSRYRLERHRLEAERVDVERQLLAQQGELDALREALVMSVRERLQTTIENLSERQADAREVSAAIRDVSHGVWDTGESESPPQTRIRDVLWSAVRSRPLPAWPAALLWGVSATGSLIAAMGVVVGLMNLTIAVAVIAGCLSVANVWISRRPSQWGLAVSFGVAAAFLWSSPISYLLFDPRPWETGLPVIIINVFWLPIVVALTTLAAGALTSSQIVLANMAEDLSDAELRKRVLTQDRDSTMRELAAQIHGAAHSPMVAGAALLEQIPLGERQREDLVEQIGRAVSQIALPESHQSLREVVDRACIPWDGLVDVDVEVRSDGVEVLTDEQYRTIERVVDEGIANAFRHGGASAIEMRIDSTEQAIVVDIRDDGTGVAPGAGEGLGARLMSAASSHWSLSNVETGGAHLHVEMPLSSTGAAP